MLKLLPAAVAVALALPTMAMADSADDIAAIRKEMETMRATYEARLQALERRLQSAEAAMAAAPAASAVSATAAGAAAPGGAVPQPATAAVAPPATAAAGGGATAFNPSDLAHSLGPLHAHVARSRVVRDRRLSAAAGRPDRRERAASASPNPSSASAASIDLRLQRGAANIAIEADNSVSVEEAYVQTTSLGYGLSLKAGRFFSGIGYLNPQHSHTWDFVDNPLAYQAMLGTQYDDDGVQLHWLPAIDQYVELGVELGRGRSFPGSDSSRNGAGMYALTAHTGGDIGDSHNWRAGVSMLDAKASDQALVEFDPAGNQVAQSFSGSTRVWIADAVWKWAPNGNATRTNFKLQGEYLQSTRSGDLVYDVGGADLASTYRARQSGWYLQGIYQFVQRWRVGARAEELDSGTPDYGVNTGLIPVRRERPRKGSLMLDFSPSEFSRVRLQVARDRAREGFTDTQWFLQYQMSLGAHGAHTY